MAIIPKERPKPKIHSFQALVQDIFQKLRKEIKSDVILEQLILHQELLERNDTIHRGAPESVTETIIIEPILQFLGYREGKNLWKRSGSAGTAERREADYTLEASNDRILVEAEPLNKDLFDTKRQGIDQMKSYLEKRSFKADLGIATNGFDWVLLKYDAKSFGSKEIDRVDLRGFFIPFTAQQTLSEDADTSQRLAETLHRLLNFSSDKILETTDEFIRTREEGKERITAKFYEEYMRYVFGYDKKSDRRVTSLLTTLRTPPSADEESKRIFVISLMSRLIFIKFLEDKRLVTRGLLRSILTTYRDSGVPSSFYQTYLRPLFYDVFNTPPDKRRHKVLKIPQFADIPYLNGGLFRQVVADELQYDVDDDDVLEIIIEKMLEKYNFTLKDNPNTLNPEILGLVFEKTVNYLTKNELGAYYTPDNVTAYISNETIRPRIFAIIKDYLKTSIGWNDAKIGEHKSLEEFLDDPPPNPKIVKGIYNRIRKITVLDPACGSGHFLTAAMKELFQILRVLASIAGMKLNDYEIKKSIIVRSLYGVDIERAAVEIARLRLWLGLIEDLDTDDENGEIDTLPNIEYNIEEGNALTGFAIQPTAELMGLDDLKSVNQAFDEIDGLKETFRLNPTPSEALSLTKKISEKLSVYVNAFDMKLLDKFRDEYDRTLTEDEVYSLNPFHWQLKFSEVFRNNGGFDIILGNPPYVQRSKLGYPTEMLLTNSCGNTYAYFFEVSLQLLQAGGYIGFIVPISSICTDRMIPLQQKLTENCDILRIANFDDRPSKIFAGLEHCRSSIIVGRKKQETDADTTIYSTNYNRWYSRERYKLFSNLTFVDCTNVVTEGCIPKLGSNIEIDLLLKLMKEPQLSTYLTDQPTNDKKFTIWYHNAPQYWIRAMNFVSKFEGKNTRASSHVKPLYLTDSANRNVIISVLNSSLFYWFFIISSNCRDLTQREICHFHIDLNAMSSSNKRLLAKYCSALMSDLRKHSKTKVNRRSTGTIKYQEFYPKFSKKIIDKIDDVLADHYSFTKEQSEFIKTFDLRFRMGEDDLVVKEKEIVSN